MRLHGGGHQNKNSMYRGGLVDTKMASCNLRQRPRRKKTPGTKKLGGKKTPGTKKLGRVAALLTKKQLVLRDRGSREFGHGSQKNSKKQLVLKKSKQKNPDTIRSGFA